jgi:hypothetical protein
MNPILEAAVAATDDVKGGMMTCTDTAGAVFTNKPSSFVWNWITCVYSHAA